MATAAQAAEAKAVRELLLGRLVARVEHTFPKRGPSRKLSIPYIVDRVLHVCSSGCSWRDLEVVGGSPKTVYHHFNKWSRRNTFDKEFHELARLHMNNQGAAQTHLVADTSFVKTHMEELSWGSVQWTVDEKRQRCLFYLIRTVLPSLHATMQQTKTIARHLPIC